MDWKKLLPEGPIAFVGVLGFAASGYVLIAKDAGSFVAHYIFGAMAVYCVYRLIKKFKATGTQPPASPH
jgi:hypothetical protein